MQNQQKYILQQKNVGIIWSVPAYQNCCKGAEKNLPYMVKKCLEYVSMVFRRYHWDNLQVLEGYLKNFPNLYSMSGRFLGSGMRVAWGVMEFVWDFLLSSTAPTSARLVHNLFTTCLWLLQDLLMIVYDKFVVCSWLLLKTYVQIIGR